MRDQHVVDLILEYTTEFQALQKVLLHFVERYDYVDVEFVTLDDIGSFLEIMRTLIPNIRFMRCIGGCDSCDHGDRDGLWTYVDVNPIRVHNVVHFVEKMRERSLVCSHEMIGGLICAPHVAYVKLKTRECSNNGSSN